MRWHCGAAHRWKGAAGGNFFRVDIRRQIKGDVPTPRETLHPQHLQAKEFRRQWGQTHGLQATMHISQSCEQQPAQLQNLPRLLSVTSMMQHKCGPLWHPGHVSSSRPGNECGTIGPLAISSQKTRWVLHAWNICRSEEHTSFMA